MDGSPEPAEAPTGGASSWLYSFQLVQIKFSVFVPEFSWAVVEQSTV